MQHQLNRYQNEFAIFAHPEIQHSYEIEIMHHMELFMSSINNLADCCWRNYTQTIFFVCECVCDDLCVCDDVCGGNFFVLCVG
jgi:hypothetical protein